MQIVINDLETNQEIHKEIADPSPQFFEFIKEVNLSDDEIKNRIDRMSVSADVKALLYSFSKAAIRAGKVIVKVGRKIIDFIFALMKAFPNITLGIIFGLVVGAMIAAIPVLGFVLGPLAAKLAVLFGFVLGAKTDFMAGDMSSRIEALIEQFAPLRT